MGIHSIKKTIATGILVAFVGTGMVLVAVDSPKPELASQQFKGKDPADDYKKANQKRLVKDRSGNYEFEFIVLTDQEIAEMSPALARDLNFKNVFIKTKAGYFVQGQGKLFESGGKLGAKFVASGEFAYYVDFNAGVLNTYSAREGKWSKAFSTKPGINLNDIRDARGVGLMLDAFVTVCADLGISEKRCNQELAFILNNFGVFLTDEKGAIIDSIFHRAQFRLEDGRVGIFTVSGQIDPVSGKGYNFAQVPGGNIYVGLGGDMVDIRTLLTDAQYHDLALAILNNKSIMSETFLRVNGSWMLQRGQLSGIAEDIKKLLDYDTANAPNRFDFTIVDGRMVVMPR